MARFKLKTGSSLKALGTAVFNLGALRSKMVKETDRSSKSETETTLLAAEDDVKNTHIDVDADLASFHSTVKIEFHYDGVDDATGDYMLHVLVPDLDGKEVKLAQAALDPDFDFTDFATECMGQIVIFGCGR